VKNPREGDLRLTERPQDCGKGRLGEGEGGARKKEALEGIRGRKVTSVRTGQLKRRGKFLRSAGGPGKEERAMEQKLPR